jgi:hypothetical protein
MKNWLRRKILCFIYPEEEGLEALRSIEIDDGNDWPDPLNFKIQKANGGHIVEVRHYQRKNDERYVAIHIVPEEQNLQEAIAKIMTYESLKK